MRKFLEYFTRSDESLKDWGLLILRVAFALDMMLGHGIPKLLAFAEKSGGFPDPLGVGNHASMVLAIFAEVFCSLGLLFGFLTRAALIPLMTTMVVAFFLVHGHDDWMKKDPAFTYLAVYVTLFVAGPGRFTVDQFLRKHFKLGTER